MAVTAVAIFGSTLVSAQQVFPVATGSSFSSSLPLEAENLPEMALGASGQIFGTAAPFHPASSLFAGTASFLAGPAPIARASGVARGGGAIATGRVGAFSSYGVGVLVGFNGVGADVATPLSRRLNLRVGGAAFKYSDTFVEQGANVTANLQLRSGHAMIDLFPFHNGFHVSPMLVYANNNNARGAVIVPAGSTITLNGSNYVSSTADPLHGSGSIDFRKTSPGLTVGWGNLVPRSGKHLSFPIEVGFYYVGQPALKVSFTGSACDPTVPESVGCESVDNDADFQKSLTAFIARNNNNLSYASFFPVISTGIGYRF